MKSSCRFLAVALAVFVAIVFSSLIMAQGWEPLTAPAMLEFHDVDFTNPLCGTVVGENSTILRTTDGGQTWITQTGPADEWLLAVSFANDSVGVIGGTGGTILFTQNAGAAWTTVQNGWYIIYHAAHQFSPTRGMVAGVNTILAPFVAYTANSWQDCTTVMFYLTDPGQIANEGTLYDVQMLDSLTAVAAAHVWDTHGAIVRTTDGGGTWSTVYWAAGSLLGMDFPTPTIGYAVGISGQRLKSTDAGLTWTPLPNPLRVNWWDVDFVNADTGWIVGENASIYRTNDGGGTWEMQHAGSGFLYGVDFVNGALGYAVGEYGMILKTTTGGNPDNLPPTMFSRLFPADSSVDPYETPPFVRFTWSSSADPEGGTIAYALRVRAPTLIMDEIFFTTDTSQIVAITLPVENLDELHSIFWSVQATDGIDTTFAINDTGIFFTNYSAADDPPRAGAREIGLMNYPNPFNASTVISLTLPQAASASLRIFDVAGREVFNRGLGVLEAGTLRTKVDAHGLPSGVYFARLETPRGIVNHKMVLLR